MMTEVQTGRFAVRTRARYALFLELSGDAALIAPLRRQRREFERWTESMVADAGIPDPPVATRLLMALCEGIILHRLTVDPGLDPRSAIALAVGSLHPR